jgi:trigger factor
VQKRLTRLAKTVRVAGFRPGKVPLKMVAQQYGPQVRSDVIADAVQKQFNDAVRSQNLRVAGYPRIEQRAPSDAAAPDALEFSAVFEVYPDVTIGDVSTSRIERPVASVTPADVDRTLDVLRKQRTTFERRRARRQPGDRVLVDFTGTIDGVEFPRRSGARFSDHARRRPHAARVRRRRDGHAGGRDEDLSADVPRRLSTARKWPAARRSSRWT